jgi:hypothetical protein
MLFFAFLAQFCVITAAMILHCGLLFCTESHCIYSASDNAYFAKAALYVSS